MDTSKIGVTAAKAMEIFEKEYADNADAVILEAAIVFEVRYTDHEGEPIVETPTACSNDSRVYQTGLFKWALELSQDTSIDGMDDPDENED